MNHPAHLPARQRKIQLRGMWSATAKTVRERDGEEFFVYIHSFRRTRRRQRTRCAGQHSSGSLTAAAHIRNRLIASTALAERPASVIKKRDQTYITASSPQDRQSTSPLDSYLRLRMRTAKGSHVNYFFICVAWPHVANVSAFFRVPCKTDENKIQIASAKIINKMTF